MLYQLSYVPANEARPNSAPAVVTLRPLCGGCTITRQETVGESLMLTRCALGVLSFFVLATASALAAADPCWNLVYRAIEHSAASRHVPYISYVERERITIDGRRFEFADANITYRDDGLASVDDDRWDHPFLSRWVEPGPPVLGPYGESRRASWLAYAQPLSGIPIIADTTTGERNRCLDLGDASIDGRKYARIVFPDSPRDVPSMKAMWIDRSSLEIGRLLTSAWIQFSEADAAFVYDLADFTVDFETIDGVNVVQQIHWTYSYRVYDQRSTLNAEYRFAGYHFDDTPPSSTLFAAASVVK